MKPDRLCKHNATSKSIQVTIVAAKDNEYFISSVCVFATLVIQHLIRMRHIVKSGLSGPTIFSRLTS
jgi:hypothetical protein